MIGRRPLLALGALGAFGWTGAALGLAPKPLVFPADHGAHPDLRTEWWYVTGWAEHQGRLFGFQVTFFRSRIERTQGLRSRFAARQLLFAHAALTEPRHPRDPFKGLGKIGALGIKVSRHCTYHGMSLNVSMDLAPYERINPCGYNGLRTVDLASLGVAAGWEEVAAVQAAQLVSRLAP